MTFRDLFRIGAAPAVAVLCGCAAQPNRPDAAPGAGGKPMTQTDPLLAPWQGPWGGVPPFGRFKPAELRPALEAAMDENLAEIDRIAGDAAPPTFDNTIAAM